MRAKPLRHACGVPPPLIRGGFAAVKFYRNTVCYCETKPLCQGLPCQGSCRAAARLRGWTKDAFRVSGITQVLLCTTSPTSSLRSMPPPLVGEALAFRDVFQQTSINLSKTKPLCQGLPCQERLPRPGEVARKCRKGNGCRAEARLRGWTKDAFRLSGERRCCSVQPLRHLRFAQCHLP